MTSMMRSRFIDGRHRGGGDPFGYRSAHDDRGMLRQPRQLEVVPDEAEVVRRVWTMAATSSTPQIARELNVDGVGHRGRRRRTPEGDWTESHEPWTRDAVKDIMRRGRLYLGFVEEKRGLDERPGHHEPILDQETYNAGLIGSRKRTHPGTRAKAHRLYLLRAGLVLRERALHPRRVPEVERPGVALLRLPQVLRPVSPRTGR
jgi:hypothetical protein